MAAKTIRELLVSIGVKADEKDLKKFDAALEATKAGMAGLGKLALGVAAGIATIGTSMFVAAESAASYADGLDEASDRTGVATGTLQELRYAADLAGVSAEELDSALTKQARTTQDAIGGSKEAAGAFRKLGISQKQLKLLSKDQGQLFEEIAGGLTGISNEQEQIDLVMSIFGRGGVRLLPMLKSGKAGIKELRAEANRLGIVMDEGSIAAGVEFSDALDKMKYAAQGLKNTLGTALLPVFTKLMTGFQDWFEANRNVMRQGLERWAKRLSEALETVVDGVEKIDEVISKATGWKPVLVALTGAVGALASAWGVFKYGGAIWGGLSAIFGLLVSIGSAVAAPAAGLTGLAAIGASATAAATGLGILLAGLATIALQIAIVAGWIAALYLVFEDLWYFMNGGNSAIGEFVEGFKKSEGVLGGVARAIENARRIFWALHEVIKPLANVAGILMVEAFEWAKTSLLEVWDVMKPFVGTALSFLDSILGVSEAIGVMSDALNVFGGIQEWIAENFEKLGPYLDMLFGDAKTGADVKSGLKQMGTDIMAKLGFGPAPSSGATPRISGARGMSPQAFAPKPESITGGSTSTTNTSKSLNQPINLTINGNADQGTVDKLSGLFDQYHRNTAATFAGGDI